MQMVEAGKLEAKLPTIESEGKHNGLSDLQETYMLLHDTRTKLGGKNLDQGIDALIARTRFISA